MPICILLLKCGSKSDLGKLQKNCSFLDGPQILMFCGLQNTIWSTNGANFVEIVLDSYVFVLLKTASKTERFLAKRNFPKNCGSQSEARTNLKISQDMADI